MEIIFKPKIDPNFSCPQSVLYLPYVIEGIKKGEITIHIVEEEGDENLLC